MNTSLKRSHAAQWCRSLGWGTGMALLALTPKCFLCVAAYLGVGAALGLSGPEFCGAPGNDDAIWVLSALGGGVVAAGVYIIRIRRGRCACGRYGDAGRSG